MEQSNCPVDGCSGYIEGPAGFSNQPGQKPVAKRDCPKCGTALAYWQDQPGWVIDDGEMRRRKHADGEG